MLCRNPISIGNGVYTPCGGCIPCRVSKRRLWASRIELESYAHEESVFLTLTYDDDNLPISETGLPTLRRSDLTNWLKRQRKAMEPLRVRYFACGEYGDTTERPHYHCALYGYPRCKRAPVGPAIKGCSCSSCSLVRETWGHGHILVAPLSAEAARYIAGYVTKKMLSKGSSKLNGREPEFPAMSLKPGIGVPALPMIAKALEDGFKIWDQSEDVPNHLIVGGNRKLMMGKYLMRKLREEIGRPGQTPDHVKRKFYNEMLDVLQFAKEHDLLPKEVHTKLGEASSQRMEFWEKQARKKRTL